MVSNDINKAITELSRQLGAPPVLCASGHTQGQASLEFSELRWSRGSALLGFLSRCLAVPMLPERAAWFSANSVWTQLMGLWTVPGTFCQLADRCSKCVQPWRSLELSLVFKTWKIGELLFQVFPVFDAKCVGIWKDCTGSTQGPCWWLLPGDKEGDPRPAKVLCCFLRLSA